MLQTWRNNDSFGNPACCWEGISPADGYSERCFRPILYTPTSQYNDFLTSNMLIGSAFQQKKFAEFSKADPHPHDPRLYRYLQFIQLASQTPERMQFSSYLQRQTCSEFACWVFYNSTIVQYFNSNIGIVPPPINIQQWLIISPGERI